MTDHIEPRLAKGMRDIVGATLVRRAAMVETIRGVFERYGFQPLETPILELRDVLVGAKAGETAARIYSWRHAEDEIDLGLRFDLTVPLARFVAANPELRRPFKRYQIGPVFRVDKPGAGRFREFLQFDIDTVGTRSMLADAEILLAMGESLGALGLPDHTIRWNHRGILNGALRRAGVPPALATAVIRVIDKEDKIGLDGVRAELGAGRVDEESGARIEGVGLPAAQIEALADFLRIEAVSDEDRVEQARALLSAVPQAQVALAEIDELRRHLTAMGGGVATGGAAGEASGASAPPGAFAAASRATPGAGARIRFAPKLARGMDYYTGPIFEATLDALPEFGSIMGGGRYDELVSRFSGEAIAGVGASIGVDRLLAALEHPRERQGQAQRAGVTQVLVTVMDRALLAECQSIVRELRAAGLRAELWLEPASRLGEQLRYASYWGIPYAVILGSDEARSGKVTIKDLEQGRSAAGRVASRTEWVEQRPGQFTLDRTRLAAALQELLAAAP
jgi:histidyl-tRNA synthetase